ALFITGSMLFGIFTDYIWMGTIGFEAVYTTMLYSKITLGISGFVLFFILSFITLYFIRLSYMKHFSHVQLPPYVRQAKIAYGVMILGALLIGVIGSLIVQGLGWEPALKFMNYETFGETDPFFGLDIS